MGARTSVFIFALLLTLCAPLGVLAQKQVTVLRGATLIDVNNSTRVENSVVIMQGGRFVSVGKDGQNPLPRDAQVIDLKGKFLIPGLVDSHLHYRDWFGEILLANGITSLLDQANPTEWSLAMKEAQKKGKLRAPRFFVTGNQLDGAPTDTYFAQFGYMDNWVSGGVLDRIPLSRKIKYSDAGRYYKTYLDGGEDARVEVHRLIQEGVDAIKVHHMLAPSVLKAITDEAHRANLPVVGHRLDARELATLGMDFVEHTSPIAIATITDKRKLQELKEGKLLDPRPYMDPAAYPALIRTLVANKIFYNPTLSGTFRGVSPKRTQFKAEFENFFGQPNLQYIPATYLKNHLNAFDLFDRIRPDEAGLLQSGYRNVEVFLKAFVAAGGKVLAGSDPAETGIPGIGIHQEMELLVDAGLSPGEALKAATLYGAQLLRKEKDLGTIAAGKLADLVVLDADPLTAITNTRKIDRVFLGGEPVDISFHADYKNPIPRPIEDILSPAPFITNLVPNIATEGSGDLTAELFGQFYPSVKVTFNKTPLRSTFEDAGRLKVVIPRALLENVGTFAVQAEDSYNDETFRSNRLFFVVRYK